MLPVNWHRNKWAKLSGNCQRRNINPGYNIHEWQAKGWKKTRLIQNASSFLRGCFVGNSFVLSHATFIYPQNIYWSEIGKQNPLINCLIDSNFTLKEILYFNSSGIHSQFYVSVHCINYMVWRALNARRYMILRLLFASGLWHCCYFTCHSPI